MADHILEIIKAELRPGFDYKPVTVQGQHGGYQSHRWVRRDLPEGQDVAALHVEAKKFLREQMQPRRMDLRGQWQGWVQHLARLRAMGAEGKDVKSQLEEARKFEKQYGKIYRQYRLEQLDYLKYVKELEAKAGGKVKEEKQGALFPKEELTPKPEEKLTSHFQHQFDSSPEITAALANMPIISRKALNDGCNSAYKVRLEDGKTAVWKMQFYEASNLRGDIPQGTYHVREALAYDISEALGWHLVPPTTVKEDEFGDLGSIQLWQEGDIRDVSEAKEEEKWRMALFDLIIGNEDRHFHNFLIKDDGGVIAIDNGLALPDSAAPGCYRSEFGRHLYRHKDRAKIPKQYLEEVRKADWGAITNHVKKNLGFKAAKYMGERVAYLLETGELFDPAYDRDFHGVWRKAHSRAEVNEDA